jgi:predicted CXXCH cytochrome family protein
VRSDPLLRWKVIGLIALAVIVVSVPLHAIKEKRTRTGILPGEESAWRFVGSEACAGCHEEAYEAWRGSHHDLSTAPASEGTVLGDFGDAELRHGDITVRFSTRDGDYFVSRREGDGQPNEYRVAYTLGVEPLQSYLIPFPGGRFQVLDFAWDTERGQWFNLYPDGADEPGDWSHWTGGGSTWNGMCAECHSTNLVKGYDLETRSFSTAWSEIDIGCEACHGPGSRHVRWAEVEPMARLPSDNYELLIRTSGIHGTKEVELCAPCHSRRIEFGDYDHRRNNLLEYQVPSLLRAELYFADGQVRDREQVYVYGSYQQSAMYRAGVRCGSCHDVHSLTLLAEGNALCFRCHQASTYDAYEHHFHQKVVNGESSDGATCVKCHMPESRFMLIDDRADHSMLIPRPDLTVAIGVPNPCSASGCHDDRPVAWAADQFRRWYGEAQRSHFATTFAAARRGEPGVEADLAAIAGDTLYPPVVRASALALLQPYRYNAARRAFRRALEDDDALVRHAATSNLMAPTTDSLVAALASLLLDPVRTVRLAAASRIAEAPAGRLQPYQREALEASLLDFQEGMEYSLHHPVAAYNLGLLASSRRDTTGAETYYRAAIEADRRFYPAKMNLAQLLRSRGAYEEAEGLFREILASAPATYEAAYSLGTLLGDSGRYAEAVELLRLAAEGVPGRSSVYFHLSRFAAAIGREAEAEAALQTALALEPDNLEYQYTLASFHAGRGDYRRALELADRMIAAHPDDETGQQVKIYIESLLLGSK